MMEQKTEIEIKQAIADQATLCKETGQPDFAPTDGICFRCRQQIYQNYTYLGRDGKTLVTGCPHCHYSYCD